MKGFQTQTGIYPFNSEIFSAEVTGFPLLEQETVTPKASNLEVKNC